MPQDSPPPGHRLTLAAGAEHTRGPEGWSHGASVSHWAVVREVSWVLLCRHAVEEVGKVCPGGSQGWGEQGTWGGPLGARAPASVWPRPLSSPSKTACPPQGACRRQRDPTAEQEAPTSTGPEDPGSQPPPAHLTPRAPGTVSISPMWERMPVSRLPLSWPLGFSPGHRTFLKGQQGKGLRKLEERLGWEASEAAQFFWGSFQNHPGAFAGKMPQEQPRVDLSEAVPDPVGGLSAGEGPESWMGGRALAPPSIPDPTRPAGAHSPRLALSSSPFSLPDSSATGATSGAEKVKSQRSSRLRGPPASGSPACTCGPRAGGLAAPCSGT